MDFDKLKKAAKETLKIVSSKKNDEQEPEEISVDPEEASSEEEKENMMDRTQRIDLKNVLDIFKKKFTDTDTDDAEAEDITSGSDREPFGETEAEPDDGISPEPLPKSGKDPSCVSDRSIHELKQALDMLDAKLDAVADKEVSDFSGLNEAIAELSGGISELHALCAADNLKHSDLSDAILSQLGDADKKLKNISNSMSGISKLGDSIFDLKNSQMNTKNALGDLEASFYNFKKKINTSVLTISVLAAVIAILEIINLLS